MTDSLTNLREADGVAMLTLDRPEKRNALSGALRGEIVARLGALEENESVRAVVLTGAPPAFCAGFDRSEIAALPEEMPENAKRGFVALQPSLFEA